MRPRPELHETEIETETKKWSWSHSGLETLTSCCLSLAEAKTLTDLDSQSIGFAALHADRVGGWVDRRRWIEDKVDGVEIAVRQRTAHAYSDEDICPSGSLDERRSGTQHVTRCRDDISEFWRKKNLWHSTHGRLSHVVRSTLPLNDNIYYQIFSRYQDVPILQAVNVSNGSNGLNATIILHPSLQYFYYSIYMTV